MARQSVLFVVTRQTTKQHLLPSLEQHYSVKVAHLRREALQYIEKNPPDLVLVDAASVRFNIARFFEALSDFPTPIYTFLLLGKGTRLDQVPRANGHLRHPISPRQLIRRLNRVIPTGPRQTIEWQGLCLDIENRFLIWQGQQVPLTPKQAALARFLLESPDTIVSRAELMKEVWGTDYLGDTRTLDVHVHWLRKALTQLEAPFTIVTERGVGYRLSWTPNEKETS